MDTKVFLVSGGYNESHKNLMEKMTEFMSPAEIEEFNDDVT